jgi:hypothetical protein
MRGLPITPTALVAAVAISSIFGPTRTRARGDDRQQPARAEDGKLPAAQAPANAADTTYPTASELVAEYMRAGAAASSATCTPVTRIAHDLVVILPDPRGSHLDWAFDSAIESVRRAHERVGYVLDRYWLPWGASADSLARRIDTGKRLPLRMRAPGVMLFRNTDPARDSIAVVWLVGETPTRGVHSAALRAALDDRSWIRLCPGLAATAADSIRKRVRSADSTTLDTVRIVGPIASGSARSLRGALDDWRRGTSDRVSIATGGATAPQNALILRSCSDTGFGDSTRTTVEMSGPDSGRIVSRGSTDPNKVACDQNWLTFTATVHSVDLLKQSIERFLHNGLAIRQSEIAYLTESGTAYGRSLKVSQVGTGEPGDDSDSTSNRPSMPDTTLRSALDLMPLEIPFPMSISRLRREYARQPAAVDTQSTPQPGWRTRLPWEDPASVSESPEVQSDLMPAMVERTVSDIEQTLLLHKIRAVGILATDVRDRLFLASLIRERLRDVRVFLIGSNALYLRPELNRELRGSLVVSTYPLFLESQFWDVTHNQDRQRLVFASDVGEGTYNATLLQLGHPDQMLDYAQPMPAVGSVVWRDSTPPPIWITVVGRHSLLPVLADSVVRDASGGLSYAYLRKQPSAYRLGAEAGAPRLLAAVMTVTLIALFGLAFVVHLLGTAATIRDNLGEVAALMKASLHHVRTGVKAVPAGLKAVPARVRSFGRSGVPTGASNLSTAHGSTHSPRSSVVPVAAPESWDVVRLTLLWHRHSWLLFRFVTLVCAFAPLVLILFRPRAHGSSLSQLGFGLVALTVFSTAAWTLILWARGVFVHAKSAANVEEGGVVRPLRLGLGQRLQHGLLLLVALGYIVVTAIMVKQVAWGLDDARAAVFFLRAMQLDSGVTPIMPLAIGGALLVAWSTWHINRVKLLTHMSAFEAANRDSAKGVVSPVVQIRNGLLKAVPGTGAAFLIAGMALLVGTTLAQFDRSVESAVLTSLTSRPFLPNAFDALLRFLILASIVMLVWGLYRLLIVWWGLADCLKGVDEMPIGRAFERLPDSIASLTRLTPFDAPSDEAVDAALDHAATARWLTLWQLRDAVPVTIGRHLPASKTGRNPEMRSAAGVFHALIAQPFRDMLAALCQEARKNGAMYADSLAAGSETRPKEGKGATVPARPPLVGWVPAAQDLIALYVIDYVEWVVRHLRRLAFSLLVSLALTTFLLSSYPFEPQSLIKGLFFTLMGATVVAIAVVLFQMNRNSVLSRITGTQAGHVTWDTRFVINLALVAGLPIISVVSAEFPRVRLLLFAWIAPVLRALGKG